MNQVFECKACQNGLKITKEEYIICPNCGSANYVSKNKAEDDNRHYFNEIYSDINIKEAKLRKAAYLLFEKIFKITRIRQQFSFDKIVKYIHNEIIHTNKSLEIGFGGGDELIRFLNDGANIYGLDLSEIAVNKFKEKYSNYQNRVYLGSQIDVCFNLIYCNALFEHLDEPVKFLETARNMLLEKGKLILRIPYLREYPVIESLNDINLWAPCHRVVYSLKGVKELLRNNGYNVIRYNEYDYYGYKVMNQMLKESHQSIMYYRNPYLELPDVKSHLQFIKILVKSLFGKSNTGELILILEKC